MWLKNKAATRSAAEQHELGCPLPAAVVAVMEWMRSWFAIPERVSTVVSMQNIILQKANLQCPKGKKEKAGSPRENPSADISVCGFWELRFPTPSGTRCWKAAWTRKQECLALPMLRGLRLFLLNEPDFSPNIGCGQY